MKKSSLGRRSMMSGGPLRQSAVTPRNDLMCTPYSDCRTSSSRMNTISKAGDRPARSITMSTDSRRSSTQGKLRKDDRPLGDKNWQSEKSSEIMLYFSQDLEGREVIGGVRNLRNMSTPLFLSIFNILMIKLDKKAVEMNKANYITQVPIILKILDYLGKVDKSLLQTVNTPHNFGFVLGILDFLLTLVRANDIFIGQLENHILHGENDFGVDEEPINSELMYEGAREWFQDRHEGKLLNIIDQFDQEILEKSGLSDKIFRDVAQKQEDLVQKEEQLEAEKAALQNLRQKQADLENQLKGKHEAIKEATDSIEDFKQRVWQAERCYEDCIRETVSLGIVMSQLMNKVDQCNLAKNEIAEKEEQRKNKLELNKQIIGEKVNVDNLSDIVHRIDTHVIDLQDKIDKFIAEYNKVAIKLAAEVAGEGVIKVDSVLIPCSYGLTEEQISKAFKSAEIVMKYAEEKTNKLDESILNFQLTDQELRDEIKSLKEELQTVSDALEGLRVQEESLLTEIQQVSRKYGEEKESVKEHENMVASLTSSLSAKSEEIFVRDEEKINSIKWQIDDRKLSQERMKKTVEEKIKTDTQRLKEKYDLQKLLDKLEQ